MRVASDGQAISSADVLHRRCGRFEERARSVALPGLDLDGVARIVISTDDSEQAEAVRAFRGSLRRR
jgi:hypothetical protein